MIGIDTMEDLKLKTEIGDFFFCPTFIIKDKLENPLLHVRFNRKEKLVLYHITENPDSKQAAEKLKTEFTAIAKGYGEDWIVYDIVEYIKEIDERKDNNIKLDDVGIIRHDI
jgi:hypothetical protein